MKKSTFISLIIVILLLGGILLYNSVNSIIEKGGDIGEYNEFTENSGEENFQGIDPNHPEGELEEVGDGAPNDPDEVKTFIITGENYKFLVNGAENPDITVKEGDRVHIEFKSTGGFHDWSLDEFDAATQKVSEGESSSVDFIATSTGTFQYYCSVGNHRDQGMKGNLIVE